MRYAAFIVLIFFSAACARNPVTGQKEFSMLTERQEIQIGKDAYKTMQQAEGGLYTADPKLVEYVQYVGKKVAKESARPHLEYEFVIINDPIPNAWTLPGGKIAINRGLLAELKTEAELAAVLGHEIVHADARHGAKGIERGMFMQGGMIALGILLQESSYNDILVNGASVGAMLVQQKYSRHQEFEADRYGMVYMSKAGYDPNAAVTLQETFLRVANEKKSGFLDGLFLSHPPTPERIEANKKSAKELQGSFVGEIEYQEKIKSLKVQEPAYKKLEEGEKAFSKKNFSLAKTYADEAIALFPDEAQFWHLRGAAFLYQKQPKEALQDLSHAITLNSDFFALYLNRGQAKVELQDFQSAKKDLKKSIELLPTGEAHELLGKIYLQEGNKEAARYHLEIAGKAQSPAGERARALLSRYLQHTK